MNWRQEYERKLISAENAAKLIKSRDRVVIAPLGDPPALTIALAARKDDLKDVEIWIPGNMNYDCGWYGDEYRDAFNLTVMFAGPLTRPALANKKADFDAHTLYFLNKPYRDRRSDREEFDYYLLTVSPPDEHGYCSFGNMLWWKKAALSYSRTRIAEVDANQIRTYGDNFVHVSEIDHFVEHTSPPLRPIFPLEVTEHTKRIAEYVSTLVRDGDTLQIGFGTATDALVAAGCFDNKHDLGVHSETTLSGIVDLVKKGIVTGKRKTLHPGKVIASAFWPDAGALDYINGNPIFELYGLEYVNDIRTIAAHDNMVAVNSALAVDLTGQIASESLGPRMWSAPGGQLDFAVGALSSKGGRYIVALPSTVTIKEQRLSRIMPQLPLGTFLTVPRTLADYVVTEYGIASLLNKPHRKRAQELIAIAHPDFRAELKREADRLFYP